MTSNKVQICFLIEKEAVDKINLLIKQKKFDSQSNFVRRVIWEYLNQIDKPIRA
jgi:Arc/MetJ-type ribon-helix-helix transcriptional regulator